MVHILWPSAAIWSTVTHDMVQVAHWVGCLLRHRWRLHECLLRCGWHIAQGVCWLKRGRLGSAHRTWLIYTAVSEGYWAWTNLDLIIIHSTKGLLSLGFIKIRNKSYLHHILWALSWYLSLNSHFLFFFSKLSIAIHK